MKKDNKLQDEIASDLADVSGVPVAEASKPKKATKSAAATALLIAPPTLTSPAPNELEWTVPTPDELGALTPEDASDDRVVCITVLQWGYMDAVAAANVAAGSLEIKQFSRVPPITKYVNDGKQSNGKIPAGTWPVRVAHLTATKAGDSYLSESLDDGDQIAWSAWLEGIVFS